MRAAGKILFLSAAIYSDLTFRIETVNPMWTIPPLRLTSEIRHVLPLLCLPLSHLRFDFHIVKEVESKMRERKGIRKEDTGIQPT